MVWSNVADGPCCIGDRKTVLGYLGYWSSSPGGEALLDWADIHGSSSPDGDYWWGKPGMIADRRWLPRENLKEYAVAYLESRYEYARALTEPPDG